MEGEEESIQKAIGSGVDVSFDCAGFNKTMTTTLTTTCAGNKVCLVGMGHHEMIVPLTRGVKFTSGFLRERDPFILNNYF